MFTPQMMTFPLLRAPAGPRAQWAGITKGRCCASDLGPLPGVQACSTWTFTCGRNTIPALRTSLRSGAPQRIRSGPSSQNSRRPPPPSRCEASQMRSGLLEEKTLRSCHQMRSSPGHVHTENPPTRQSSQGQEGPVRDEQLEVRTSAFSASVTGPPSARQTHSRHLPHHLLSVAEGRPLNLSFSKSGIMSCLAP